MSSNRLKQKSILIIAHSYKPVLNPRAFRWTAIAEQLIKEGYAVDIITSWQPGMAREEKINDVNIFRVGGSTIEKLRNRFSSSDKKTTANLNQSNNTQSSNIKNLIKTSLHFIHDHTWKKLYWPDYACLWKKSAIESALYLLNIENYDTMITVSDPFTSHLVGYEINKQYPNLRWLVDIGDPFCFRHDTPTNNHSLYRSLNYKTEKNIFAKADIISVTTESTKEKYAELFAESANKIKVIPPLMAPSEISDNNQNAVKSDNIIKLIFVGTLYKAIRNPKFLLQLFDQLLQSNISKKLELHFYGGINDCHEEFNSYQFMRDNNLFMHGLVPRDEVLHAMEDSTILINIGNDNVYQLPSKIVEYVLTGKPIINLVKLQNDSSTSFLKSYSAKLIVNDNGISSLKHELKNCVNFINDLPEELSQEKRKILQHKFSPETITKQYQELINHSRKEKTEVVA